MVSWCRMDWVRWLVMEDSRERDLEVRVWIWVDRREESCFSWEISWVLRVIVESLWESLSCMSE
jgi:hypothetical protein